MSRSREHDVERPTKFLIQKCDEIFQPLRLLAKVSRRTNEGLQLFERQSAETFDAQHACLTKICQRPLDVCPRSVLSEDGADNYLERSFGRPPVLWAPGPRQLAIDCANRLPRGDDTLRFACGLRFGTSARLHGCVVLPCLSCCFQPRMRALLASASASGTIPLR